MINFMSNGEKKRDGEQGEANSKGSVSSVAQMYTERLDKSLEGVLVELRQCGEYDKLTVQVRSILHNLILGGSGQVAQCDKETISGVAKKLSEIQSILESDKSKSYVLKIQIKPQLKKMVEELGA